MKCLSTFEYLYFIILVYYSSFFTIFNFKYNIIQKCQHNFIPVLLNILFLTLLKDNEFQL